MRLREITSMDRWRLPNAYAAAGLLLACGDRAKARRELLQLMYTSHAEQRKRAADVARRTTEKDSSFLAPAADELACLLSEVPPDESRTRWHLGLAVARTARTRSQVTFAIGLMWRLAEDPSNVVRCSAIEGLGELVVRDPSSRSHVLEYFHEALRTGTGAMKCRARLALKRLDTASVARDLKTAGRSEIGRR